MQNEVEAPEITLPSTQDMKADYKVNGNLVVAVEKSDRDTGFFLSKRHRKASNRS